MFFDDQTTVEGMQEAFPTYSDKFPIWAVQSNAMLQIKLGMVYLNGKASGGTKQTVCASCLSRGEIVTIVI